MAASLHILKEDCKCIMQMYTLFFFFSTHHQKTRKLNQIKLKLVDAFHSKMTKILSVNFWVTCKIRCCKTLNVHKNIERLTVFYSFNQKSGLQSNIASKQSWKNVYASEKSFDWTQDAKQKLKQRWQSKAMATWQ